MNVLLDTHALIWWLDDDPDLNGAARDIIADTHNDVYASAASLWEVGIKYAIGKMPVHPDILLTGAEKSGLKMLDVTAYHAVRCANLPLFEDHRDPFDRILVTQALVEDLDLITADGKIRDHQASYGVRILWGGQ